MNRNLLRAKQGGEMLDCEASVTQSERGKERGGRVMCQRLHS